MAGVTQIDTAGIGELMDAYTSLARVNGMLKLLKLKKLVECVFRALPVREEFLLGRRNLTRWSALHIRQR